MALRGPTGVTVLKPLKGVDPGLERNLISFFEQDYPDFELILSAADKDDPALAVVTKLLRRYPNVAARVIAGAKDAGPNPKVNNLLDGYASARNDWILISDSNVRADEDYLARLMAETDARTGVVTSIVAGTSAKSFGGLLEATFLNTFFARGMRLLARFGRTCVVGKSMLFRKSVVERLGGLRTFAIYLAEDDFLGQAVSQLGYRLQIARDPVPQHIGRYAFSTFWSRHVRWGRIRKSAAPAAFWIEPLSYSWPSGLIGSLGLNLLTDAPWILSFAGFMAVWALCDALLMSKLHRGLPFWWPVAWVAREALALPLWAAIACGDSVAWRGKRFIVRWGGLLEEVPQKPTGRFGKKDVKWITENLGNVFSGAPRRALIKSRAVTTRMIGGLSKWTTGPTALSVQELVAITGTDFKTISHWLATSD